MTVGAAGEDEDKEVERVPRSVPITRCWVSVRRRKWSRMERRAVGWMARDVGRG
jgi:hypothetical protein